jgi:hypothetical protein
MTDMTTTYRRLVGKKVWKILFWKSKESRGRVGLIWLGIRTSEQKVKEIPDFKKDGEIPE